MPLFSGHSVSYKDDMLSATRMSLERVSCGSFSFLLFFSDVFAHGMSGYDGICAQFYHGKSASHIEKPPEPGAYAAIGQRKVIAVLSFKHIHCM